MGELKQVLKGVCRASWGWKACFGVELNDSTTRMVGARGAGGPERLDLPSA